MFFVEEFTWFISLSIWLDIYWSVWFQKSQSDSVSMGHNWNKPMAHLLSPFDSEKTFGDGVSVVNRHWN